jgi:hypothetical protein
MAVAGRRNEMAPVHERIIRGTTRGLGVPAIAAWALTVLLGTGCGDDGGGTESGRYLIEGYLGGTAVPDGIGLYVGRVVTSDPSAKTCSATVNGTPLQLRPLLSTDDDAFFSILTYDLVTGTAYVVSVTCGARSASAGFTATAHPWITITAPADASTFGPGSPIDLAWSYDGGTVPQVHIRVSVEESDAALYDQTVAGSNTTHTIPGSATASWGAYPDVLVTVDGGEEAYPFTGELAVPGSVLATVYSGDAVVLTPL